MVRNSKIEFQTPNFQTSWLWDPVNGVTPPPNRIVQDILRVGENLLIVVEADGAVVPGVCDHNGHRNKHRGVGHGHYPMHEDQTALGYDAIGLHPDCVELQEEDYGEEWGKFFGNNQLQIEELEQLEAE